MKAPRLTRFKGLNNVGDPMEVAFGYLRKADNIDITSAGKPTPRKGSTLHAAGSITSAYATLDHQRMYYVDAGALKAMDGPTLRTGLGTAPMSWTEVNEQVYFTNGVDSGIIEADNTLVAWAWPIPGSPALAAVAGDLPAGKYDVLCTFVMADGRETGAGDAASINIADGQALQVSQIPQAAGMTTRTYLAPANSTVFQLLYQGALTALRWSQPPDYLGDELRTEGLDPLPAATVVQAWNGRVYGAVFEAQSSTSRVFPSEPLGFHLFDLSDGGFIPVVGRVLMLAPTTGALLIGTDRAVYAWDGTKLNMLAGYGVVPGWCWAVDDEDEGNVTFWSVRGLCRALPFVNLTAGHLSVAPGVQAGAAVIAANGQKKFVVALHAGGTAFNQR